MLREELFKDRTALAHRWVDLIRVLERLARASTFDDVVAIVRSDGRAVAHADGVTFVLRDGEQSHYLTENAILPLWQGRRFPLSECVSGWCIINGTSAVIPNVYEDARVPSDAYRPTFVSTMVMVPVGVPAVGAIGFYWSRPHTPAPELVLQLEELSRAAGAALERVQAEPQKVAPTHDDVLIEAETVNRLDVVAPILDVVCQITGMGFAAIAKVTDDRWIACAVKDEIAFGLKPGGELDVRTTICNEVRNAEQEVVIDDVMADANYRDHPTPAMYGFRSYISIPIYRPDGSFFGTLCAIDPSPAQVSTPHILATFRLFAKLIGLYLDAQDQIAEGARAIHAHQEADVLREQFIAVLGHDLRNPLAAVAAGIEWLDRRSDRKSEQVLDGMRKSAKRMGSLIDDILDFARGRLAGGIAVEMVKSADLHAMLIDVVDEVKIAHPDRLIISDIDLSYITHCDPGRIAQLLSNLLANALTHGAAHSPISVDAKTDAGRLSIEVANSGKPIPVELRRHIFEPFSRTPIGDPRHGLGLGLYICSEIARAHGGRLTFTSNDRETRFRFEMPNSV